MTAETKSWLVGCLRAGCVFAICAALGIVVKQHPKFFMHAALAVVMATVFAFIAWLFRPPIK